MRITRLHLILLGIIAITAAAFLLQIQQENKRKQELIIIETKKELERIKVIEQKKQAEQENAFAKDYQEKKQKIAVEAVAVAGEYCKLAKLQKKDFSAGRLTLRKAKESLAQNNFEEAWALAHQSIKEFKVAPKILKKLYYKVRFGDCLWKIAKMPKHYGRGEKWVKIWQANKKKIPNHRLIYPKQVLLIPKPAS